MKRYFIWKDGKFNGDKTEWQEISGQEFYKLVNSPEGKNRFFANSKDREYGTDECVFEVTRKKYLKWKQWDMAEIRDIQEKYEHPVEMVSLDQTLYYDDDGIPVTLGDTIPAPEPDPLIEDLYEALDTLSDEERELIDLLFFNNDGKSERQISEELGMPQKTLNCKKLKILAKLRCHFAQN